MISTTKYYFCLSLILSFGFSEKLKVEPLLFTFHSSNGSDWIYDKSPITTFGAGIGIDFNDQSWSIEADYLQLGFLGKIGNELYEFSSIKSLPYLDQSKDADGYWSEYVKAKITYESNSIQYNFGIFDRHWGHGKSALHISRKPPSYPQLGFKWEIKSNLNLIYFHGFLNSGISDSTRAILYNNEIGQRSFNLTRNIVSHRIEWSPVKNLELGVNESVIYASRDLDIHYMIPIAPFYPIENYLGDTDNIQMGFDISYVIYNKQKFYLGFFMDEITPEWIFKSKNHNWFAWQIGFNSSDFIMNKAQLILEYNWTDQRIYKHKYIINDYYSHGQPLGFWAGPHSEELLVNYLFSLGNNNIEIDYSYVKRGLVSDQAVDNNYNDTYNDRYSDGKQTRKLYSIRITKGSKFNGLNYRVGINQAVFDNLGFTSLDNGVNSNKISLEFGLFYNFIYNE